MARAKIALLASCLGQEASQQIIDLIENNQLNNPEAISALPPWTFIQLATSGMIRNVLKNSIVEEKLKGDLATVMAKEESRVSSAQFQILAESLRNGSPSGLPDQFTRTPEIANDLPDSTRFVESKSLFDSILSDYQAIAQAISEQKLNSSDSLFNQQKNPTAIKRLCNIASCGLSLRQMGAPIISDVWEREEVLLAGINQAITNHAIPIPSMSDEEIKELFRLPKDIAQTVIRKLRNAAPYISKQQFLEDASYDRQKITGYAMWSAFYQKVYKV